MTAGHGTASVYWPFHEVGGSKQYGILGFLMLPAPTAQHQEWAQTGMKRTSKIGLLFLLKRNVLRWQGEKRRVREEARHFTKQHFT